MVGTPVRGRPDQVVPGADQLLGKGEMRERYLGVRIPPTNLKPDFVDEARRFANQLAHRLVGTATTTTATATKGVRTRERPDD